MGAVLAVDDIVVRRQKVAGAIAGRLGIDEGDIGPPGQAPQEGQRLRRVHEQGEPFGQGRRPVQVVRDADGVVTEMKAESGGLVLGPGQPFQPLRRKGVVIRAGDFENPAFRMDDMVPGPGRLQFVGQAPRALRGKKILHPDARAALLVGYIPRFQRSAGVDRSGLVGHA